MVRCVRYAAANPSLEGTMADKFYAKEKMGVAVWILATSPGRIKERLFGSAIEVCIVEDAMPPAYLSEYESIVRSLNSQPAQAEEGTINATLAVMDEDQAVDIAKRICELDSKITL